MQVQVRSGDITTIPVDAIVTLINSEGMWSGGVDRAINSVAGNRYHRQAGAMTPLRNQQVVVAKGDHELHLGEFDDVIFVVDDLEGPVGPLVKSALEAAKEHGYKRLAFPAIRTGVTLGVHPDEPDARTTVQAIAKATHDFYTENHNLDIVVYFVVYSNAGTQRMLAEAMLAEAMRRLPGSV